MIDRIQAVVLAAGQSTRMKSSHSKMVHKILGKEIINFILDSLSEAGVKEENIIIVAGKNIEELKRVVKGEVHFTVQDRPLGMAHALLAAADVVMRQKSDVLVLVGDNPYIHADQLKKLLVFHFKKKSVCTFISAVFPSQPPPYGRVIRDRNGDVIQVVEEFQASRLQLETKEVNSSLYALKSDIVLPLLSEIDNNNPKNEYYLSDMVKILTDRKHPVFALPAEDYRISIGINNRWDLQQAERDFNRERLKRIALENGVTILQPESTTVEFGVEIGRDTVLYPSTYIAAGTRIGKKCHIGPFVFLENVIIADNQKVRFQHRQR